MRHFDLQRVNSILFLELIIIQIYGVKLEFNLNNSWFHLIHIEFQGFNFTLKQRIKRIWDQLTREKEVIMNYQDLKIYLHYICI